MILLREVSTPPKRCDMPPQAHHRDTPFCSVSCDNCAIPHKNKHDRVLRFLSLQVWRDMKSIAVGPLSQPPLLLKKVSQYTSSLYCNTPPICTAVLSVPLREIWSTLLPFVSQYASHLYRNTPPICIAIHWEHAGGWGHWEMPPNSLKWIKLAAEISQEGGAKQRLTLRLVTSLDGPIRENRFADSRESPVIRANHLRDPKLNPFFANHVLWALRIANRRFEVISRESLKRYENRALSATRFALRIAPMRANRPDSRRESPGHLSAGA